jgi:S-DNA-T family DNA segregation ATPase FtsK/SpoIIIE
VRFVDDVAMCTRQVVAMTPRERLQAALAELELPCMALTPVRGHSVDIFPLLTGKLSTAALNKRLDELAGRLQVAGVRGRWLTERNLYALEIPRLDRQPLLWREVANVKTDATLPLLLGQTVELSDVVIDLASAPHILIGGATGGGKSTAMLAMLAGLLSRLTPQQLQLVAVDPKRVELSWLSGLPYLACEPVVDVERVAETLTAVLRDVDKRYKLMAKKQARDIATFNKKSPKSEQLPHLVLIVDELASIMAHDKKAVEPLLARLCAEGRAAGCHVIIATQRPHPKILTPLIKDNIPTRLAFAVPNYHASAAILDTDGARALTGAGDALLKTKDGKMTRLQTPYITEHDLDKIVEVARAQQPSRYRLDSLPQVATIDASLSPLDAARELAFRVDWLSSSTLVEAGIATSNTVGKQLLSELRDEGIVGAHDFSKRASPVLGSAASATGSASPTVATVDAKQAVKNHVSDSTRRFDGRMAEVN